VFSFIVQVECPNDNPNCSDAYLREETVQQLAPIFISYAFLFVALTFWYSFYYWYDSLKKQREAAIIRISDEEDKTSDINY
jgi:hypothetical protein